MDRRISEFEYTVIRFVFLVNTAIHHSLQNRIKKAKDIFSRLQAIIKDLNEKAVYGDERTYREFLCFNLPPTSTEMDDFESGQKFRHRCFVTERTLRFFYSQWLPFCQTNLIIQDGQLKSSPQRCVFLLYQIFMRTSLYYSHSEYALEVVKQGCSLSQSDEDLVNKIIDEYNRLTADCNVVLKANRKWF